MSGTAVQREIKWNCECPRTLVHHNSWIGKATLCQCYTTNRQKKENKAQKPYLPPKSYQSEIFWSVRKYHVNIPKLGVLRCRTMCTKARRSAVARAYLRLARTHLPLVKWEREAIDAAWLFFRFSELPTFSNLIFPRKLEDKNRRHREKVLLLLFFTVVDIYPAWESFRKSRIRITIIDLFSL